MLWNVASRARLAGALGEARVHARIADDAVARAEQWREHADVRLIARPEQDHVAGLQEPAQPVLELLVDRQRAAHHPLRRQPDPVLVRGVDRGLLDLRVGGQAEEVVRGVVDDLLALLAVDHAARRHAARAREHDLALVQPGVLQPVRLGAQQVAQGLAHGLPPMNHTSAATQRDH
ncbi:MAG TPA: hypothetical protein VFD36_26420, partial [Kofleriaceae bacterium]|nr:hypothetical protein [Kofleriaceae bacterium]